MPSRSSSTLSVSWPSRRPACRIAPGVPPIRKIRFCIFSGPRSSSSMVVIDFPFLHVRVVHQLFDVVDRGERGAGVLERGGDLLVVPRADPSATGRVDHVGVFDPFPGRGEPGLLGDVRAADEVHDPFGDRGGAGRDGHPAAVSGEVGVAGGVVGGPVAVPAGDDPELVVDAGSGAEDADQRFEQGQVDDLPGAARGVPVVEREHHRVGAGEAGDAVGEAERRQRRGSVLLPGLVGQAAHRLGERAERAALGVRPGLAEAGDPQHHQRPG